jgi:glyoxylase-like metal-dependent hydrolase (beta-lactamase superfamily II)
VGHTGQRARRRLRGVAGCLSYLIGSGGDASVIDASLPADIYVDLAAQHGWRIRYALESHIHADHVSRARQVVERTGATLLVPTQDRAKFPFTPIRDGDRIVWGRATLRALHTPGHTAESTSYVLNGRAVFTGDTLFVNGVGRPDLHADAEGARQRAALLFHSLKRLGTLGSHVILLPAHTSEPVAFDGKPVCARLDDAATWLREWLVSESAFVDRVVARLPPTPPNFARIVELNEAGRFPDGDATDLEAGANRCAVS